MKNLFRKTSKIFGLCVPIFFCFISFNIYSQSFSDVTSAKGIIELIDTGVDPIIAKIYGGGASVVDFDNDGDLDFFVGTNFGQTSQLYRNNGSGQFQEVASSLGISNTDRIRVGLWIDYNGDELLDLILVGDCFKVSSGCVEQLDIYLYRQTSGGQFEEETNAGLDFNGKYNTSLDTEKVVGGVSAADINNDGWLDVFVSVWGAESTLFLNNGNGTFSDISIISNLAQSTMFRWQSIFHDFDRDGDMDVYVNVDFDSNEFWLNNGDSTFQNIANTIGADHPFNEMGMTLGDYDNDGDFDIYATNISRIDDGETQPRHNILLRNDWSLNNTLSFVEISENSGINVGASGWDWGTTFFDSNNDGYVDLASTNGWPQINWSPDPSKLWLNIDGLLFSDISNTSNFNDNWEAASLVAFDMERDGDLDLLQSMKLNIGDKKAARLYENNYSSTTNSNNYLVVKPRLNGSNHFAIGAKISVTYNGVTNIRLITAGTSHFGQEPAEAFFGVGNNSFVDEIKIEWPDNTETIVNNISSNQVVTVMPSGVLKVNQNPVTTIKIYPNPVTSELSIKTNKNIEKFEIYNLIGQKVLENTFSKKINVSSLSDGIYFLKLLNSDAYINDTFNFIKK
ncbi:FG-GAP-like repeat-containing protein [Winogradskyella sp.]|nr:FG-GAP-like repeat-containing protein [Winogradskyella sp.]